MKCPNCDHHLEVYREIETYDRKAAVILWVCRKCRNIWKEFVKDE